MLSFIVLVLPPLALGLLSLVAKASPGPRPQRLRRLLRPASWLGLGAVALEAWALLGEGPFQREGMGMGVLWALQSDGVSLAFGGLLAVLGGVLVRFTGVHLDGEAREGAFQSALLLALGAGWLLAHSASWPVTLLALGLQGLSVAALLNFYGERAGARQQTRRFLRTWWVSDTLLVGAALLLSVPSLGIWPGAATLAACGLVAAAALKAALWPAHRWLTEALEVPTPVSALFHAGVVSAGVIVLLRQAPLLSGEPLALALMLGLGLLSLILGLLFAAAQGTVKESLAFSTVNQMGLLFVQLGLQLWPLALLHAVSHGLYKAHAFLRSGSAVRRPPAHPSAPPSRAVVLASMLGHGVLYGALLAGLAQRPGEPLAFSPQALGLGLFLSLALGARVGAVIAEGAGVARWLAPGLSAALLGLFLLMHEVAFGLWGSRFPEPGLLSLGDGVALASLITLGSAIAFFLATVEHWRRRPWVARARVAFSRGVLPRAAQGGTPAASSPSVFPSA